MAKRELDIIDDLIDTDRDIGVVYDDLVDARISERELSRVADEAIALAEELESGFSSKLSWDDIIAACYTACIAEVADKNRVEISRSMEQVYNEVSAISEDMNRSSRRGSRSSRGDRSSRRDRRDNDRDRDRSSRGRRTSRRDEREDSGTSTGGFGKAKKTSKRDRREEEDEVVKQVKIKPNTLLSGKTQLFDINVVEYINGALVEKYEDHELSPIAKQYDRSKVEEDRRLFIEDTKEKPGNIPVYPNLSEFINLSPDSNMTFGLIRRNYNFSVDGIDRFDEIFSNYVSNDAVKMVFGILSELSGEAYERNPQAYRIKNHIDVIVRDVLNVTFNSYSRISGGISGDVIDEWKQIMALLDSSEVFNPLVKTEFKSATVGLFTNLLELNYDPDAKIITFSSNYFTGKVLGDFSNYSAIAGDGRVAEINQEFHPILATAVTSTLDARDATVGDAWSPRGCLPVIIADSTGGHFMVFATKSSDTKYTPSEFHSLNRLG